MQEELTGKNYSLEDKPKPFLQHLEELRWTMLWSLAAVVTGMLVCLPLVPHIFRFLCAPLSKITAHPEMFLRSLEITGAFSIVLQLVVWGGLILSAPFLLILAGRFVFPGLTAAERKMIRAAGVFGIFLFFLGVGLGYFFTLPIALKVFFKVHGWLGIQAEWTAPSYVSFCMHLLLLFGLAFQLPVVLIGLGYLGIVTSALLRSKRRHAIVAILVLAALLTPGPDMFSQLIMALPMYILYELCIWVIWLYERQNGDAAEKEIK
jgi:sec-independent protein translocase protein TatC